MQKLNIEDAVFEVSILAFNKPARATLLFCGEETARKVCEGVANEWNLTLSEIQLSQYVNRDLALPLDIGRIVRSSSSGLLCLSGMETANIDIISSVQGIYCDRILRDQGSSEEIPADWMFIAACDAFESNPLLRNELFLSQFWKYGIE
ncbi:MAG: hypothetical protein ABI778_02025 [Ignavibacteriota bacterium]